MVAQNGFGFQRWQRRDDAAVDAAAWQCGGGAAVIIIIIPSQSAGGGVIDSKDTVMLDSFICGCFNGCTKTAYEVCVARRRWLQDDEFEHHVRLSQVSATTWGSFYHSLRQLLAHLLATWIIALHHAGHFKTAIVSFPLFLKYRTAKDISFCNVLLFLRVLYDPQLGLKGL